VGDRKRLLRNSTLEKFCNPSTTKKSSSRSMANAKPRQRQEFSFGSYLPRQSEGILLPQGSSQRWPQTTSGLKLRAPRKQSSLLCPMRVTHTQIKLGGNGKHEYRIPKSPKKHSVQKRPLRQSKRRPRQAKRQVSAGSLFRKVAKEQVGIEIDGDIVEMARWDAYVRQIYTMALNRNNSAARLLDHLRRQFPGDLLPRDKITFIISETDAKL
jgi:hypothetical protein